MSLTSREKRFVAEYLKDQNATKAIVRCGYKGKNARVIGPRLYARVGVRAAIDAKLDKIHEDAGVTQERILTALLRIAEIDPRKLFDKSGLLLKIHEIPDQIAATIASIESDDSNGEVRKIKFWDKTRALELLGKHLKMFTDRAEISDGSGAPVVIQFMPANYDPTKNRPSPDDKGL